jgi:6-phosphofructokinase 1
MENLHLSEKQLAVTRLGAAEFDSPLGLSTHFGDLIANYVDDEASVSLLQDRLQISACLERNGFLPAFLQAGPRKKIYFEPRGAAAAIVTCGGLCPGINNVIRALVMELFYRYGVKDIWGVQYGYWGFGALGEFKPRKLTPDLVKGIHEQGGSFLGSSRGPREIPEIVDCLKDMKIDILFTIGGDGTLRGARDVFTEIQRRGLRIAVVGVPKTIDNDIAYVEKTFGLETAFSVAAEAIRSAHTEAVGAINGIGIVKVMGRFSGFIAANAALALNEVNYVLVPEVPFELQGERGLLVHLKQRLQEKGHAVIIAAEGAGQDLITNVSRDTDKSGNVKLKDIGVFLKQEVKEYFKGLDMNVNLKYIDPSYMVRSVPANAHDSIYCVQLAQNAVHAAMAGYTGVVVGRWNNQFTLVPLELAVSERKFLNPDDELWLTVIEATGQPFIMTNKKPESMK